MLTVYAVSAGYTYRAVLLDLDGLFLAWTNNDGNENRLQYTSEKTKQKWVFWIAELTQVTQQLLKRKSIEL